MKEGTARKGRRGKDGEEMNEEIAARKGRRGNEGRNSEERTAR